MPTATYDPANITLTFAGNIITGFADATFISAERNEDTFSSVVGSTGEVARVRSRNKTGQITVTLLATSLSNDVLSAIQKVDEVSGLGISPLLIKDIKGTTLLSAQNAWIMRPANVEFAKDLPSRDWVFECASLEMNIGGNLI